MPTAREALLDAALAALVELPWSAVRMVDVASAAGVSRQTLYNEFGSKEGLARALVRREADAYLQGVERVLAAPSPPRRNLAAVAEWTVSEAFTRPVLRALLTGCWGERLPVPRPARAGSRASSVPAQRRADAGVPSPADLLGLARDRAAAALQGDDDGDVRNACEVVLRLALSYVVAPVPVVADGHWADPESWRPMTPTITSVIDTIFRVDTMSPRKIIP
ncbi:TetR/AcrR family transcriptional regulator [Streptomyces sp. Je 1-79]|uniref:TetR/AcrR family transcriptional regulator n=1 Tax=Streptomyces sp. Je 1-79 TaxID=2943847 RepID=UPI0021A6D355|nr:TetR/AcrR family transcriptional regulator [Streptomyces sp. Je 1-79]MCT4355379.1 TetR/AcrR family transcriptional regulator [Streptomyces sp. Je 1-79]